MSGSHEDMCRDEYLKGDGTTGLKEYIDGFGTDTWEISC